MNIFFLAHSVGMGGGGTPPTFDVAWAVATHVCYVGAGLY